MKGYLYMPKTILETAIEKAASDFALTIVKAVKGATLDELLALQTGTKPRRGRKPGSKSARRGLGHPPKNATITPVKKTRKKRINYPKCAFPGCGKNRYTRGRGFCGEHNNEFLAGKIKSAEEYKA